MIFYDDDVEINVLVFFYQMAYVIFDMLIETKYKNSLIKFKTNLVTHTSLQLIKPSLFVSINWNVSSNCVKLICCLDIFSLYCSIITATAYMNSFRVLMLESELPKREENLYVRCHQT